MLGLFWGWGMGWGSWGFRGLRRRVLWVLYLKVEGVWYGKGGFGCGLG